MQNEHRLDNISAAGTSSNTPYEGSLRWFREIQWWAWVLAAICADGAIRMRYGHAAANYASGFLLFALTLSTGGLRLLQIRFPGMRGHLRLHIVIWFAILLLLDPVSLDIRSLPASESLNTAADRFLYDVSQYGNPMYHDGMLTFLLGMLIRWLTNTVRHFAKLRSSNAA